MLTHRRHRYLTRWPRRLAFALAILLLLAAVWRAWQAYHPALVPAHSKRAPASRHGALSTIAWLVHESSYNTHRILEDAAAYKPAKRLVPHGYETYATYHRHF